MSEPAKDASLPMLPLTQRPLDLGLCIALAAFALTTASVDLWAVTGWLHGDNALALGLRGYTSTVDPLFGEMPQRVWVLMLISLCVLGPLDVLVALGLARQRAWVVTPGRLVATMQLACMLSYLVFELTAPNPPLSWGLWTAANGAYYVVPTLLLWRLRRGQV